MATIVEGKGTSSGKSPEVMLAEKRSRKATQNHNARANAHGNGASQHRAKDPVRNPRGFRGTHIVLSSPLMEAAKHPTIVKRSPVQPQPTAKATKVIDPVQRFINKLASAIDRVAKDKEWTLAEAVQAYQYAGYLIKGETIDVGTLPRMIRRTVEKRFATTAWFMHETLESSNIDLPGMQEPFFDGDYTEAQLRFHDA